MLLEAQIINNIAIPRAAIVSNSVSSVNLALAAARVADDNRGRDILVLDVRELTPIFDYFVIATGTSRRQLHAISDDIARVFRGEYGQKRLGMEGYEGSRWILLDYGDVVVHLFDEEARGYYDLEHLWSGSKYVPFESDAQLRACVISGKGFCDPVSPIVPA